MFLKYPIICSHVYCYSNKALTPRGKVALYSNPNISLNNSCLYFVKAFDKISATIHCIGQYSSSTTLFSIFSLIKWCYMSICFDLSWLVGFLTNVIEPWFSHMMIVASSCTQPTSFISCLNQMASILHRFMAMYFAPIVDCATVCCRLLFHNTATSPTNKTYPKVDLRFSTSPAQSASK
jgi:hypothetical protein